MAGKKERKFKRNIFNSYHPTVIEGEYMLHLRLPDNKNKLLGRAEASDDGEHLEQAEDTQFDEKSHYAYAVVTRTFAPHGDMHFQEFLIDRNANYRLEFTPYRSKSIKRKTNPDFVSDFDTPDEKPTITYLKENETPGDLIREDGQKLRPKERLQGEGVNRAIQLLHDATPQLIGAVESMRETKDKPTLEALTHRAVSRGTHIQHRPIADAKDIQPRQFTPPKKSDPRAVVKQLDKVGDHRAISPEDMKPKRLGAERTHVLDLEVDTGKALEDARQKYLAQDRLSQQHPFQKSKEIDAPHFRVVLDMSKLNKATRTLPNFTRSKALSIQRLMEGASSSGKSFEVWILPRQARPVDNYFFVVQRSKSKDKVISAARFKLQDGAAVLADYTDIDGKHRVTHPSGGTMYYANGESKLLTRATELAEVVAPEVAAHIDTIYTEIERQEVRDRFGASDGSINIERRKRITPAHTKKKPDEPESSERKPAKLKSEIRSKPVPPARFTSFVFINPDKSHSASKAIVKNDEVDLKAPPRFINWQEFTATNREFVESCLGVK